MSPTCKTSLLPLWKKAENLSFIFKNAFYNFVVHKKKTMTKRFVTILYRLSPIADIIRKIVKFLQNNPEIMQTLQDMPFMEATACVLYVGYLLYQWDTYLFECFPRIYYILKKAASLMFVDLALSI